MTHTHTCTHLHNMIFTEKKIGQRKKNTREKNMPDDLIHAIASLLLSLGWCTQKLGQSDYSVC